METTSFGHFYRQFLPFIKYCLVGASGTAIDIGSLFVLVEYGHLPVLLASTLSFLLAVINNFTWNKIWTFRQSGKNYRKQFIKFLIVSVIGLGLTLLCMLVLVELLKVWYVLAKAITSAVVLTWNFLGNKYWTFIVKKRAVWPAESSGPILSIIVPAYNEAKRLGPTLDDIQKYLVKKSLKAEVIVVNDGSSDETETVAKQRQTQFSSLKIISARTNEGKGSAVTKGIAVARGQYILFMDADNSTKIAELDRLWPYVQGDFDVAIGSRYLPDSRILIKQPSYRRVLGRMGNLIIRAFLLPGRRDTQCGFKCFKAAVAKDIFCRLKVRRFGFDMEALAIAEHLHYSIIEVPVGWYNSADSRLRPIRDSLRTFFDLMYIKINLWCRRYD